MDDLQVQVKTSRLSFSSSFSDLWCDLACAIAFEGPGEIQLTDGASRSLLSGLQGPAREIDHWFEQCDDVHTRLTAQRPRPRSWPSVLPGSCERHVGVNIGGGYVRVVRMSLGEAIARWETPIITNITAASIVDTIANSLVLFKPQTIGIAWSAPRVAATLVAESEQMRRFPEFTDLMRAGTLDAHLQQLFNVPVTSWNDGEALSAYYYSTAVETESVLSLKLGTSIAGGYRDGNGVSLLPVQISKFVLPEVRWPSQAEHPITGSQYTVRTIVGAAAIRSELSRRKGTSLSYDEYIKAYKFGDVDAHTIFNRVSAMLYNLGRKVQHFIDDDLTVQITGRNISDPHIAHDLQRALDTKLIRDSLIDSSRLLKFCVEDAENASFGAAEGAGLLAAGQLG